MVRYTKYRKEYNKAEFTTKDSFVNKKLNRKEGEIVEDDEKIIVQVENPTSSKVLKNKRGFEMRNREKQNESKKARIICLKCRQSGHKLSACPQQSTSSKAEFGNKICYKCGAKDHSLSSCPNKEDRETEDLPFAKCFVCGENGHLAGNCIKNERGKYPKGGSCKICGDVRHFGKYCPLKVKKGGNMKEGEEKIFSEDEQEQREAAHAPIMKKPKVIKVVEFK